MQAGQIEVRRVAGEEGIAVFPGMIGIPGIASNLLLQDLYDACGNLRRVHPYSPTLQASPVLSAACWRDYGPANNLIASVASLR